MAQGIWDNDRIGDPVFDGFTFGGVYSGASFSKEDYPGLRAVRDGTGVVTLAVDLPDPYTVPGPSGVGGMAPVQVVESTDQANAQMTAATFVAGSPACGLSFTAPRSGKVWVGWYGFLHLASTVTTGHRLSLGWELRTGSTIGSGTVVVAAEDLTRVIALGIGAVDTQRQLAAGDRYLVTGLTPAAAYNVRTMQRASSLTPTHLLLERRLSVEDADPSASQALELWY